MSEIIRQYYRERGADVHPRMRKQGLSHVHHALSGQNHSLHLWPEFQRAFADKSITAWIADNDSTALGALDFLSDHDVKVPGDISVAGFDNTIEGQAVGLTTFDFGVVAMANACFSFIMNPTGARIARDAGKMGVSGMVIPRKTTGPA